MTPDDIALGMRLKEQAGWNQTEADWRRCLQLEPDGGLVAEWDGVPVGTVTTCVFGPVAWVAMVLVDAAYRGRGIGKALMTGALAWLDARQIGSVRLDATPLGQPLYEKLGFTSEYTLTRYGGLLPRGLVAAGIGPARREEYPDLVAIDCSVTATDRGKLLLRLFEERPEAVRVARENGRPVGFLTSRPGANALQIGPCLASASAGPLLLADAGVRYAGRRVFIDIPAGNTSAWRQAETWGLTPLRFLVRMGRGEPVRERIAELWASSGPEKG